MESFEDLSFDKLPKAVSKLLRDVEVIKKLLINKKPREETKFKKLSTDKAINFFNNNGFTMSKSKLYKLTSQKKLPFETFGKRLVFDEKDLGIWLQDQTKSPFKSKEDGINLISNFARKKINTKNN